MEDDLKEGGIMQFFQDRLFAIVISLIGLSWLLRRILGDRLEENNFSSITLYNVVIYSPQIISFILIVIIILGMNF